MSKYFFIKNKKCKKSYGNNTKFLILKMRASSCKVTFFTFFAKVRQVFWVLDIFKMSILPKSQLRLADFFIFFPFLNIRNIENSLTV
jgi:hypothetical protein